MLKIGHHKHPILEMRESTENQYKNLTPADNRLVEEAALREITFFNSQQAQKEKEKVNKDQRQVFKLSASTEK